MHLWEFGGVKTSVCWKVIRSAVPVFSTSRLVRRPQRGGDPVALSCCVDHFLGSLCPLRGEGHCVALTDDDVNKQHMMMETVCPDGSGLFQNDITSTAFIWFVKLWLLKVINDWRRATDIVLHVSASSAKLLICDSMLVCFKEVLERF